MNVDTHINIYIHTNMHVYVYAEAHPLVEIDLAELGGDLGERQTPVQLAQGQVVPIAGRPVRVCSCKCVCVCEWCGVEHVAPTSVSTFLRTHRKCNMYWCMS
jgi:hypothetical protein